MKKSDEKTYNESIEKKKIIFQFFLVSVCSFVAGILLTKCISEDFFTQLNIDFNSNLDNDFLCVILKNSLSDIFIIIALYIFSFSFINYLVTDITLSFFGFKMGLYVYFYFMSDMGYLQLFALVFIKIILFAVILIYACSLAIKSLKLIKKRSNGRVVFDTKALFSITALAVSTIGAALILNTIYLLI